MGCTLLTKGAEPQCDHGRNSMTVRQTTPPRVASSVTRFLLGSLAAIAVILIGGFFALRGVATEEAERDTRERVEIEGKLVEAAALATRAYSPVTRRRWPGSRTSSRARSWASRSCA